MITVPIVSAGGVKSTVTLTDPVIVSGGSLLFRGDYSTGNFSQWPQVQAVGGMGSGAAWDAKPPTYSAKIVTDPLKGRVARFEIRDGDVPFSNTERSEVCGDLPITGGKEGDVRWYSFSTKFDSTWPTNHSALAGGQGWAVVNQWHSTGGSGGPPIQFGFRPWSTVGAPYTATPAGSWSLTLTKMDSKFAILWQDAIMHLPLNIGSWNDVKMQICWSGSDTVGYIRLWFNGIRQTFLNGQTTFQARTMTPGDAGTYYKEGLYRNPALTATAVVYHTGFHVATAEGAL